MKFEEYWHYFSPQKEVEILKFVEKGCLRTRVYGRLLIEEMNTQSFLEHFFSVCIWKNYFLSSLRRLRFSRAHKAN